MSARTKVRRDLHSLEDLKRLARSETVPRTARRMMAIAHVLSGMSFTDAAAAVGIECQSLGGRSLFEMSLELRARATETLGGVVFVDSGSVFEASLPDFDQNLRTGAGAGLRYFSPIGPLRLDVGVPINSRSSDDAFQIYVSVGQAF